MQTLRNIAWWFIGLTTFVTFGLVVLLSNVLGNQFEQIPQSGIITVYVALAIGFLNTSRLLQLGDTLIHEIGHAQFAALTFGSVKFIRVERDASGVTYFNPPFLFRRLFSAIVSLFGPIASLVVFVITARLIASELSAYWVIGAALFIVLILITTVRNLWGWIVGLFILFILYVLLEAIGYLDPQLLNVSQQDIVKTYLINIILGITALNAGVAIRYSFIVRNRVNPRSDEFKFGTSIFLGPRIGGNLIFIIQVLLLIIGLSYLLGWSSIFEFGRLI